MTIIRFILINSLVTILLSCNSKTISINEMVLDTLTSYPKNNPITTSKITLGKKLFFDKRLSKDSSVSCASCHHTKRAFSDGVALSTNGVSGKKLDRNAPALFNLAWQTSFFWDGGKSSLENQAFAPIRHPDEMGINLDSLISALKNNTEYNQLFHNAFDDGISLSNLAKAIATYERTLISFNSTYDRNKNFNIKSSTTEGERIFHNNCAACHTPPLFTDLKFHNNGLDSSFNYEYDDPKQGHYRVSGKIEDQGKFKTPSLRNLGFTAPYMHDGRFNTLEEVLDHYSNPQVSTTLDKSLKVGIDLSINEKKELISFLHTLNDTTFTQDEIHY